MRCCYTFEKSLKTLENDLLHDLLMQTKKANYAFNMLIIQFTTISYENTLKFIKILLHLHENLPKTCKNNAFKVKLVKIMLYIREKRHHLSVFENLAILS